MEAPRPQLISMTKSHFKSYPAQMSPALGSLRLGIFGRGYTARAAIDSSSTDKTTACDTSVVTNA